MADQNEQLAGRPEHQGQSPEELVGFLEACVMTGDLPSAIWCGEQILGITEINIGESYPYTKTYSSIKEAPEKASITVNSLGNDRSDLFGNNDKSDAVATWERAADKTAPEAIGAMQRVLREGLGRYGWHYDRRKPGQFVGPAVLGADLQMRVAEYSGPEDFEHFAHTMFMSSHGFRKVNKDMEPALITWSNGLPDRQSNAQISERIRSLLYTDPQELSNTARVSISAPQVAIEGVARTVHERHSAAPEPQRLQGSVKRARSGTYAARHARP